MKVGGRGGGGKKRGRSRLGGGGVKEDRVDRGVESIERDKRWVQGGRREGGGG